MSDSPTMGDTNNSDVTTQICKNSSEYCPKCYPVFKGFLFWTFFKYLFGYSLCSRLLTLLVVLQAAVLWIGYALNGVLQFLFIPFVYSSKKSTSTMDFAFLSCCFVLPGIISFSSHYFWFLVQFAFHCYANEAIKKKDPKKTIETTSRSCSKCQQDIQIIDETDPEEIDYALLFFPQFKHFYRILIVSSMIAYLVYRMYNFAEDGFTSFVITLGLFPLGLMWVLHFMHMVGIFHFIIESFICKTKKTDVPKKTTPIHGINISMIVIAVIVLICIIQVILLWLNIVYHMILTVLLFSVYILLYWQTPRKSIEIDDGQVYCCCCRSPNNKTILYRRNFFVDVFEKFLQASLTMKKDAHFHFYKLFISIILYVMLISLNQILTQYFDKYKLLIIFVLQLIIFLIWIPPLFNQEINQWIVDKQINLVQFLIVFMCLTSIITILRFPVYYELNTGVSFIFLLFIAAYTGLLFLYYIKNWWSSSSSIAPLVQWAKSHEAVSIYSQALTVMFLLLASIGFFGLSFGSSIYAEANQNKNDPSLYPYTVSGNYTRFDTTDDKEQQYQMQACHWKFGGFNIQDMALFAALAYVPTERLKTELDRFYPTNEISFDEVFHNYQDYGYGEITYYTLDTSQAVIVVIRGTTLPYEWLIDFDIWTESTINQMISILFPWSRLYPRTVHKIIIRQMSLLENIFGEKKSKNENETQSKHSSKRFYVKDMIDILKRINIKYQNKSLLLVGHSLGGGLAKLAGIALNNTIGIVSISGPGISYTRAKYDETDGVLMDTINKRVFNIIHDRDVVPWADKQAGLVQYITCPKGFNRLQCHAINPIFCTILKNCGNPRKFGINKDICQP